MGIVFIGSQPIGHDCLKEVLNLKVEVDAVFTFQPDTHEKWEQSVDSLAKSIGIPLYYDKELTTEKIKEINPELILVIGYRKLFPNEILTIPQKGVIGLHASLLPHLKGQAPINWSIINGDKKTGITMFFMDGGIDTGDIIGQKETEILVDDTILEIKKRIVNLSVDLIKENLLNVISGNVTRIKQKSFGTYGCARIPEDGKINWNSSTKEIYNLIRASELQYAAFTYMNSKKLFILKAKLEDDDKKYFGTPGQIGMTRKDGSVSIITGDGVIRILKICLEDKKQVDAKIYLSSSKIRLQ